MANRGRGAGASYPPSNNAPPRQNEYFVPRDGIDREVITADICRYLGNDALVRPGTHTNVSRVNGARLAIAVDAVCVWSSVLTISSIDRTAVVPSRATSSPRTVT
jgi:hypothetical protein